MVTGQVREGTRVVPDPEPGWVRMKVVVVDDEDEDNAGAAAAPEASLSHSECAGGRVSCRHSVLGHRAK